MPTSQPAISSSPVITLIRPGLKTLPIASPPSIDEYIPERGREKASQHFDFTERLLSGSEICPLVAIKARLNNAVSGRGIGHRRVPNVTAGESKR